MKIKFSVEDYWQNSFFSTPGTAGGQKGTYFYLYHARQLKLHLHLTDFAIIIHPLIKLFLTLWNKNKHLTTENFQMQDVSYGSCFFETCFLHFEFLGTIQNIGNIL